MGQTTSQSEETLELQDKIDAIEETISRIGSQLPREHDLIEVGCLADGRSQQSRDAAMSMYCDGEEDG
jgi:hypothetical protein